MKLKNLKNISVFLFIITLFVSASPYKTYAADPTKEFPLVISANPVKVKPGETSKVTVIVLKGFDFKTVDNVAISVANDPANLKRCNVTKENPTCSVEFTFGDKDKGSVTIYGYLVIKTKNGTETLPAMPAAVIVEVPTENQKPTDVKPEENVKVTTDTTYTPLAPIPGLEGALDTQSGCPFGTYLNTMLKVIIGFSAVLAFVMVVSGGVQYMSSEVISSKEEGKDTIMHAIMGLLIALGSYLILNTLNPQLLNACLNGMQKVDITILKDIDIPGSFTFDGTPIKVDFNKEAYPAAKKAAEKTGVDKAFILAIFAQETSSGKNTGNCNYTNANMRTAPDSPDELAILKEITKDWAKVNVSCSGGGSSHGGAIGFTQFLPSTWKQFRSQAEGLLGHQPNAWNVGDALMMTALKLKSDGGKDNEMDAACKYFGSCGPIINCGNNVQGTYGQCVMGKKASLQKQIEDSIKKGEITA